MNEKIIKKNVHVFFKRGLPKPIKIDLTLVLGEEIAEEIFKMETLREGLGVEYFNKVTSTLAKNRFGGKNDGGVF